MKMPIALTLLFLTVNSYSQCPELLKEAKEKGASSLIITFDGLGTAEFGLGVLQKRVISKIKDRCGAKNISSMEFYYSKEGAKDAMVCAKSFSKAFGGRFTLHVLGHSFGAGKGVFNFIEEAQKADQYIENVVTYDPRGYSYKYENPGKGTVGNFVNIYQKVPLSGRKVKNADSEFDVTGKSSHVSLPKKFANLAMENLEGALSCAN
ncbi:MAG: hypothetical protein K9K67_09650 [Bacteriovoracaceae bacterium]|nr:hypothetical protein [Bacteriovoracaceae bacterium]